MLNNVLACPSYFEVAWTLTHANEYSKINAMYGPCNYKAVNWETSEEAYTTEQYEEFAAAFDAATKLKFPVSPPKVEIKVKGSITC